MIPDALALQIAHALMDGFVKDKHFTEDGIPWAAELIKSLARTYDLEQKLSRKEAVATLLRVVPGGGGT